MSNTPHTHRACAGVVARVRQLAHGPDADPDAALIESFVAHNEHAAFALVVQRHGPMVLRVCRRILGERHAAEDAFQGTFLIFAQRAKLIRKRASLASWLHGTALRVATRARRIATRDRATVPLDTRQSSEPDPVLCAAWQEVQALVDREVLALPAIYREAFVRCGLEHASCADVARELGVSEPTVRNRLSRARKRLQERLGRRGVSLATVLAALAASPGAVPAAPLITATATAACALASGQDLAALAVRKSVVALVTGASRNMFLTKLKAAIGVLLLCTAVCALATGEPNRQPKSAPDRPLAGAGNPKPPATNPAADAELANIEGVWLTEKYDEVFYYVFSGNKCTVINATKKDANEYRVEVDPSKSPKWLNLTDSSKQTWELIYELKGDTLRLAAQLAVVRGAPGTVPHTVRAPRPTEFKDVDSKSMLLTLKRITPALAVPTRPLTYDPLEQLKTPPRVNAPDAQLPDIQVLEAQVKVKNAQVKAAEVRLNSAQAQFKLLASDPNPVPATERNKAKADLDAAAADLEVRKAELGEAEARLAAAVAKAQRPTGALEWLRERNKPKPANDPPQTIQANSLTVKLPVAVEAAQRKDVREFQLYVSENEGETWRLAARAAADADGLLFEAPRDGLYWFALRVVKTDGNTVPPANAPLSADLRVQFRAEKPADLLPPK